MLIDGNEICGSRTDSFDDLIPSPYFHPSPSSHPHPSAGPPSTKRSQEKPASPFNQALRNPSSHVTQQSTKPKLVKQKPQPVKVSHTNESYMKKAQEILSNASLWEEIMTNTTFTKVRAAIVMQEAI